MPRIRVLFVDDSVVIRKLVSAVLDADPDLEVVGRAANGRIALAKIPQVNPDVVVLDVEMPEMDGLETLKVIRERYPSLPCDSAEFEAVSAQVAMVSGAVTGVGESKS